MGLADRADQRTVGTLSTLDGADNVGLLSIANAAGCAATVERVRFTRGKYRGFYKEGNGDLTLDSCEIVANGRTQTATSGRGAYFTGSSATVTATNCAFVGNLGTVVASDSPAGGAIYAGSLRRLVIDGTTFLSNGVPLEVGSSGHGSYSCYNGHSGAAIYATTAPVTARNCTFRGKGYIDETTGSQTATYQNTHDKSGARRGRSAVAVRPRALAERTERQSRVLRQHPVGDFLQRRRPDDHLEMNGPKTEITSTTDTTQGFPWAGAGVTTSPVSRAISSNTTTSMTSARGFFPIWGPSTCSARSPARKSATT